MVSSHLLFGDLTRPLGAYVILLPLRVPTGACGPRRIAPIEAYS